MPRIVAKKIDWVILGFKLFAERGESGLVVDDMAKTLKCNRSSFYWHFNTKKEFIDEVVDYWIDFDTEQIIKLSERLKSPKDKFTALLKIAFKKDPEMDFVFYLKRFARKHKHIQTAIDQIDQRRIDYVSSLLMGMGHDTNASKVKATLFYKYLIGYHEMIRYKKQ